MYDDRSHRHSADKLCVSDALQGSEYYHRADNASPGVEGLETVDILGNCVSTIVIKRTRFPIPYFRFCIHLRLVIESSTPHYQLATLSTETRSPFEPARGCGANMSHTNPISASSVSKRLSSQRRTMAARAMYISAQARFCPRQEREPLQKETR
jgi:hypothetical protein